MYDTHESTPTEAIDKAMATGNSAATGQAPGTWAAAESPTDREVNKPADDMDLIPQLDAEEPAEVVESLPTPMDDNDAAEMDELIAEPAADETTAEESVVEAPMEQPAADDQFGSDNDLFGGATQPAVEEPVMEEPAAEEPANNDLFGGAAQPAAEEPAIVEPATEEPAAEEPAGDDLFGGAEDPTMEEPVEEAPAAEEPAGDDLFGGGEDLFGGADESAMEEPASEEPVAEEPAGDDLFGGDNLFGTEAEEAPAAEETAEPTKETEEEEDDLFGDFGSVLELPGGFDSLALRHWVDNSGNYSVDARLLAVADGHVRLLKANGRTTTVPFSRLSDDDLEFINLQASARQQEALSRTAQR